MLRMANEARARLVRSAPADVPPRETVTQVDPGLKQPTTATPARGKAPSRSWLARLLRPARTEAQSAAPRSVEADPLLEFASEAATEPPPTTIVSPRSPRRLRLQYAMFPVGAVLLAGVLLAGRFAFTHLRLPDSLRRAKPAGSLTVETRPAGAEVLVDGKPLGVSPAILSLPPGVHVITVHRGSEERVAPLMLTEATHVVQYFDLN